VRSAHGGGCTLANTRPDAAPGTITASVRIRTTSARPGGCAEEDALRPFRQEAAMSLEQAERAALDKHTRLWQIDQLRNALLHKRQLVEQLTPQVEAITKSLRLLGQMQELVAQMSPDINGTGGARARDQIMLSCAAGAKGLINRRQRVQKQLDAATEAIPTLEAQLATFS